MSVVDSLRKGFRFFLMSMGVSTYPRRTLSHPETKPVNQTTKAAKDVSRPE